MPLHYREKTKRFLASGAPTVRKNVQKAGDAEQEPGEAPATQANRRTHDTRLVSPDPGCNHRRGKPPGQAVGQRQARGA